MYVKHADAGFKSAPFLNFFFARVRRTGARQLGNPVAIDKPHWTDDAQTLQAILQLNGQSEAQQQGWKDLWDQLGKDGFGWVSKCQGEWNIIHAVDTPIVYRTLSEKGKMTWAGDYEEEFDPSALLVHPLTGYLYHPSPACPLRRAPPDPYGKFSLVSSYVVLQTLAADLDIDLERSDTLPNGRQCAGTISWHNITYPMGVLRPEEDLA
ncbi:hypothetical protein MYAM1_000405 [Malassezia yamatoensis]|uniref:Uncharacterized protein n=1 Tax=Malassezia yamatoensis TaxID=253288 RepID=A0AAJ5YRX4_9BASI|nr:hypothetical protein MYAM1_000405 [Malassezia yamatoensis]